MSDVENQKTAAFNLCKTAEIYLSQGKLDEAYATCLNALEILPNCGEVYKTQGNVLQAMGKLELAKNSYIKAIEKSPNLAEAYANLGSMVRRTDLTRSLIYKEIHKYQLSADNKFFEKIEKAISQGTYKFFLATDNRQTQISFQERFPQQIITFSQNFENERLRETSVEEALIDLYLLSKTNRIIGSYRSSFSQYASKLGGVPLEIA